MSDKRNVNIITDKNFISKQEIYTGINLYSHHNGLVAQLKSLEAAVEGFHHYEQQDYRYALRPITQINLFNGVTPFTALSITSAYTQKDDNDHPILTFDFPNQKIVFVKESGVLITGYDYSLKGMAFAVKYLDTVNPV